jgi:hypothetical protein
MEPEGSLLCLHELASPVQFHAIMAAIIVEKYEI